MLGNELEVGDYIIEARGKTYQVLPTAPSIARSLVVYCKELKKASTPVMVRLVGVQRIDDEQLLMAPKELQEIFLMRANATAEGRVNEVRKRRQAIDRRLREQGVRNY